MDRYKKKAIAFGSLEDKRNLRFIRKSVDRSNVRHKRLSELRKLEESTLEELPDEKTPVKAGVQSEMSGCVLTSSVKEKLQSPAEQGPQKITYREKLQKWKEEKELKKQLEARKKIPVFKVGRVNLERPPPSVHTVAPSRNKEPLKFAPKSAQPSRIALKPAVNSRDVPKQVGKVPKPVQAVSAVPRSIPNPKDSLRSIPTTRNNSRQQSASNSGTKASVLPRNNSGQQPAGNSGTKASVLPRNNSRQQPAGNSGTKVAVLPSRPLVIPGTKTSSSGKPGNSGTKMSSAGNSTVSSTMNCSTSRVLKPPSTNTCAPKQTPKIPSVTTTTVTSKIPNQRSGIVSRIVPPRSCNKQGSTVPKTNSSVNSGLKAPLQRKLPAPKGTKVDVEKETKSGEKDEEFDDNSSVDSFCEIKSSREKRATGSFAPDEFSFTVPDSLKKFAFAFPSRASKFAAMYADMLGVTLPRTAPEDKLLFKAATVSAPEDKSLCKTESVSVPDKPFSKAERVSVPEDKPLSKAEGMSVLEDKSLSKAESVCVPEDKPLTEVESVSVLEDKSLSKPESAHVPEDKPLSKAESVSVLEDKPFSQVKSEDQKEYSEVPQIESPKLLGDKNVTEKEQNVSYPELKNSDKTVDLSAEGNTQRERKGRLKDVHLYRQLKTISENSPLVNDLDLGDSFFDEKAYKLRRSRRLASNHFATHASLDPKYFEKTKRPSVTGSDYLRPVPENPLDSPLTSEFSELSVDSPSEAKQYNFRVRKPEKENRISLLGSPVRPHIGPRKSIKGDLICFTP